MSLQYVEPTGLGFPPSVIYAKSGGGGNQRPGTFGQGAGKPKKAAKKAPKKAAKKAPKKAARKAPAKKAPAKKKK